MAIPAQQAAITPRRWTFGPAVLDERTLELTVNGATVALERKPLEVLMYLLQRPGEAVAKDELVEQVWPGRIISDSALTSTIAKLREALRDEDQQIIRTQHGHGYRLVAPVRSEAAATGAAAQPAGARRLAALLFSDIAGYTALMGQDEGKGIAARESHCRLMQQQAPRFNGRWVEEIGDESFLMFPSALDAVSCARAAQDAVAAAGTFKLRIGIHMGDVLERDGRVFGDAVNVAARIRAIAEPGGIVVSERVWEDVRNHPELGATALGEKRFKNVDHPVRVFAVTADGVRRERSLRRPVLALVALMLLTVAAAFLWRGLPPAEAGPASIAVLPFVNVSDERQNEYFADGMTEELLNALAQIEGLKVPSRTSVFAYKGQQKDLRAIGRELGVRAVLEGSVRKDRDRLRITAQLVNVADGYHLWSQTYDRPAADLFALQDELARAIVGRLRPQLLGGGDRELVHRGTASLEAYDLFLRGKFEYFQQNLSRNRDSIELLRQAIALDPQFARAHAALAQAYGNWLSYVAPDDATAAADGFAAAERALVLDPKLGEAYLARGRMHFTPAGKFAFEPALTDLKRAVELDPGLADAWVQLGGVLYHVGLVDHARRAIEKALALEPHNLTARVQRSIVHLYDHEHEKSLELAEQLPREFNPTILAAVVLYDLLRLNRLDESTRYYERFRREHPGEGGVVSAIYAVQLAREGRTADADAEIRRAIEGRSPFGHFHHVAYQIAVAYALMGRAGEAVSWLEQAVATGFPAYTIFARNPYLPSLKGAPRYERLLERSRQQMEQFRPLADSVPW